MFINRLLIIIFKHHFGEDTPKNTLTFLSNFQDIHLAGQQDLKKTVGFIVAFLKQFLAGHKK